MKKERLTELIYQALETEMCGVQVYRTALKCAQNPELKEEIEEYLDQTEQHVSIVQDACAALGLDTEKDTPGRKVVRHLGESLVEAMEMAFNDGDPEAAEVAACECIVLAETKDHLNWELIGELAGKLSGAEKKALKDAFDEVEDQEDEHLYHSMGWTRELWMQCLGLPAELPPPEEKKNVKTAIGAARAKQSRKRGRAHAGMPRERG